MSCDLEGRRGNRRAPKVSHQAILEAGWTEKSDIYYLGYVIKSMIYGNTLITTVVDWDVPAPLDVVVETCIRVSARRANNIEV